MKKKASHAVSIEYCPLHSSPIPPESLGVRPQDRRDQDSDSLLAVAPEDEKPKHEKARSRERKHLITQARALVSFPSQGTWEPTNFRPRWE